MLGNLMNIFFDGTLEESSERQVRETTPDVTEKSSTIAKPIPEKYKKELKHYKLDTVILFQPDSASI